MKAEDFSSESDDVKALVQELFDEINNHELPGMAEDEVIGSTIEPYDETTKE